MKWRVCLAVLVVFPLFLQRMALAQEDEYCSIEGRVWHDLDASGDGVVSAVDDPLDGIVIQLEARGENQAQFVIVRETVTDMDGNYSFDDLPYDIYQVQLLTDTLPMEKSDYPTYVADATEQEIILTPENCAVSGLDYSYVARDFGDLPADYTENINVPASHALVSDGSQIILGDEITIDDGDQPEFYARGDMDDGVLTLKVMPEIIVRIEVTVEGEVSEEGATLGVWVDFNENGRFSPDEFYMFSVVEGVNSIKFNVPPGLWSSYPSRFRLFDNRFLPEGEVDWTDFEGHVINGEVEDYILSTWDVRTSVTPVGGNHRVSFFLMDQISGFNMAVNLPAEPVEVGIWLDLDHTGSFSEEEFTTFILTPDSAGYLEVGRSFDPVSIFNYLPQIRSDGSVVPFLVRVRVVQDVEDNGTLTWTDFEGGDGDDIIEDFLFETPIYAFKVDFGDLPESYDNGWQSPNHILVTEEERLLLGYDVTSEQSSQSTISGWSDENGDEDDGVWLHLFGEHDAIVPDSTFASGFFVSGTISTTGASLAAWWDWDHDGAFSEDEFVVYDVTEGMNLITTTVPVWYIQGVLAVRFRLFENHNLVGTSLDWTDFSGSVINGEVEDYLLDSICYELTHTWNDDISSACQGIGRANLDNATWNEIVRFCETVVANGDMEFDCGRLTADFGDLPRSYETESPPGLDRPASHILVAPDEQLRLGDEITFEPSPQYNDIGLGDDDEGVIMASHHQIVWESTFVNEVIVSGTMPPEGAVLGVWVDWNHDGMFSEDEFLSFNVSLGRNTIPITTPDDYEPCLLLMRFRLFARNQIPGGTLDWTDFNGEAINGEVEDYPDGGYDCDYNPYYYEEPSAVTLTTTSDSPTLTHLRVVFWGVSLTIPLLWHIRHKRHNNQKRGSSFPRTTKRTTSMNS